MEVQADQISQDFSDDIRMYQEAYVNGVDAAGQPYGEDRYKADMKEAVSDRIGSLDSLYSEVMSMGDNEKVWWNGKWSKAGTVRDDITKEWNNIQGMDQAIDNGTMMLFAVPPGDQIGKNIPKFELRDTRYLTPQEQELLAVDNSGIGWLGQMDLQKIDANDEQYKKDKLLGNTDAYTKDNKTGAIYRENGLAWNVTDPVTGQIYKQKKDENGKLTSSAEIRKEATGLGYGEKDVVDYDPEFAKRVTEQQATMTAEQVAQHLEKKKKIDALQTQQPINQQVKGLVPTAKPGLQPVAEKSVSSSATLNTPTIATKEELPITSSIIKPVTVQSSKPYVAPTTSVQSNQSTQQSTQQSTYKPPTYVAPQNQQPTYQTYYPPAKTQSTAPVQQPSLATKIVNTVTGAAGQAWNKLKSWFK